MVRWLVLWRVAHTPQSRESGSAEGSGFCRERWDKPVSGQLETVKKAEEGQHPLQGWERDSRAPCRRLSCGTLHAPKLSGPEAFAACPPGGGNGGRGPALVSKAEERTWAIVHGSHAPCLPESVASAASGSALKPSKHTPLSPQQEDTERTGEGSAPFTFKMRGTRRAWETPMLEGQRGRAPEPPHWSLGVPAVWFHCLLDKDYFHKNLNTQTALTGRPLLSPVSDRNCRGMNTRQNRGPCARGCGQTAFLWLVLRIPGTMATTAASREATGYRGQGSGPQKPLSQNNLTPVAFHVNRGCRAFSGQMQACVGSCCIRLGFCLRDNRFQLQTPV